MQFEMSGDHALSLTLSFSSCFLHRKTLSRSLGSLSSKREISKFPDRVKLALDLIIEGEVAAQQTNWMKPQVPNLTWTNVGLVKLVFAVLFKKSTLQLLFDDTYYCY